MTCATLERIRQVLVSPKAWTALFVMLECTRQDLGYKSLCNAPSAVRALIKLDLEPFNPFNVRFATPANT